MTVYKDDNIIAMAKVRRVLIDHGHIDVDRTQVEKYDLFQMAEVLMYAGKLFPKTGAELTRHWINNMPVGKCRLVAQTSMVSVDYHNRRHLVSAMHRLMTLLKNNPTLTWGDEQVAWVSLLIHDQRHSLGNLMDSLNVVNAASLLIPRTDAPLGDLIPVHGADLENYLQFRDLFISEISIGYGQSPEDIAKLFVGNAATGVISTCFPYAEGEVSEMVGILRDADRLSMLDDDWWSQVYEGLYIESFAAKTSFLDFCRGQVRFMETFDFQSMAAHNEYQSTNMADTRFNRALGMARLVLHYAEREFHGNN